MHLAGIIPVASLKTDLETVFPDVLLPIMPDFTAIQKAVYECAVVGCQTIWIVANDDLAPIVRKSVGEWIYDPVYYKRTFTKFYTDSRKEVPIYYVPIQPKDRDRRDCYGWSILHGVYSAWLTATKISKWLLPNKYYVSFPLSTYEIEPLRQHRKLISDKKRQFYLSFDGRTIKDNLPLAFTLTGEDFKTCRRNLNKKTTREYLPPLPSQSLPSVKRPLKERWSARHFDLATVFEPLELSDKGKVDIDWFYDLSVWDSYCQFLGSENRINKPERDLYKPRFHTKIPHIEG